MKKLERRWIMSAATAALFFSAGLAHAAGSISNSFQGSYGSVFFSTGTQRIMASASQAAASLITAGAQSIRSGFFAFLSSTTASATASVTPGQAQTISFNGASGVVTVNIPPDAFSIPVNVTVSNPGTFPADASAAANLTGTNVGIEILVDPPVQPSANATITLTYRLSDVNGLDATELILARYDATQHVWVPLASTSDTADRRVTGLTDHFSLFQIMQSAPANTLETVKVFPNPFRPALGHTAVTFSNLPAQTRLRIYTFSGALVKDLTTDAVGMASWDATNESGLKASSGVYFVYVQGLGRRKTIKVAVQR